MPPRNPTPQPPGATGCEDCYFSDPDANGNLICHLNAPIATNVGMTATWPIVNPGDWCAHGYDATTGKWNTPDGQEPGY